MTHIDVMTLKFVTRWCENGNRIGSFYHPMPVVDMKNGFGFYWKERPSRHEKDKFFNGPSSLPRSGQRVNYSIGFDYCAVGFTACSAKRLYYGKQIGVRGYYDMWRR